MRPDHQLRVWQEAMGLATRLYRLTETFPADERFGLISQVRRAAVSVPSNIAEGAARGTRKEFVRFLVIARGSLSELDTQLRVAQNLWYALETEPLIVDIERLQAALGSLIKSQRMLASK